MANARVVFDSADLVRLIYSFGDPEHRRLTKIISNKIQPDTNEFTDNFIIRKMQENEEDRMMFNIYDYMEELPKSILVDRLKIYKRCYCCQRHNHRKPIIHEGQLVVFKGVVTESNPPESNPPERCSCVCRHYSRFIMNHLFA
jgi:hypothetical protein